ncbi:hypothetical protein EYV94_06235 [Puteibacter caeruleilacunae]|nr:hypothetical protein EYV94_06235 [Puteibacter caeruleilacunae]
MKNLTIWIVALISGFFFLQGCEKMEEVHEDFLKDGDIIYSSKPLEIESFAGKRRVKLKYFLINAVNANKCVVEWAEGEQSQTFDITPNVPLDSIEMVITDLEEKSYIFKVFTTDTHGNRSVKAQVAGASYDTKYQSGLINRPVISVDGGGTTDSIIVNWGAALSSNTGVEMMYNNRAGEAITRFVAPDEDVVVIKDWESEGQMTYKSMFIPEETAIDTFEAAPVQVQLPVFIEFEGNPIDKTNWSIIDVDSEEPKEGAPNGLATAVIDGDNSTFWHTQWDGGSPEHPHHLTIDMGDVVKMNAFELVKRQGKNDCMKEFKVEVSLDNVTYTELGTYTYEQASASQRYQLNSLPMARYIKYTALEAYDNKFYAHLAELNVEGQVATKIDRAVWTVTDFSSEEPAEGGDPNGLVIAALDGDLGTFWHTAWKDSQPDFPHYFVIDMQKSVKMFAVECIRRQGNSQGQTKFKIYTSNDGENFEDQGTFDFDGSSDAAQVFSLSFIPEARYFKYEAIEGPKNYAFLSEINVFGIEEQ